jgi:hypothetical protein
MNFIDEYPMMTGSLFHDELISLGRRWAQLDSQNCIEDKSAEERAADAGVESEWDVCAFAAGYDGI